MELNVVNEKKSEKKEGTPIIVNPSDKVSDLKNIIKNNLDVKISTNSLGLYFKHNLTGEKIFLTNNDKSLKDYAIEDKTTIFYKNLGAQISWRLTYIIEYLGPLLIVFYLFFNIGFYKSNTTQKLAFIMSTFHYTKRILESIFVHSFSRSTMPLKNLFINCAYYWILYGVICGYSVFNENYQGGDERSIFRYLFAFLFLSAELKNLKCHLILKKLKDDNQGEKGIPHGEGFELVSCANYFWEFLAWLCFSIFVNTIPFYIFTACGLFIMKNWALKRHAEYLATYGDRYPKKRKAIIPYFI
jgi:very-long-chain enoyl-CoA reductase